MKHSIVLIFIGLFFSCSNTVETKEENTEQFLKLESFESQLSYLIKYPNILSDSSTIRVINDSIQNYESFVIRVQQTLKKNRVEEEVVIETFGCFYTPSIKRRNIFPINIYNSDSIYIRESKFTSEKSCIDSMKYFIEYVEREFVQGKRNYPEFVSKTIPLIGETLISKHVFIVYINPFDFTKNSLSNWNEIIKMLKYLKTSYSLLRNKAALNIFGQKFENLNKEHKEALLDYIPFRMMIDLHSMLKITPPPPPPPPPSSNSDSTHT